MNEAEKLKKRTKELEEASIGYRKKTIIYLPDDPIRVIEHRIMQYISPATGEIIEKQVQLSDNILWQ